MNEKTRIIALGVALSAQAVCAATCITSGDVAQVAKAGSTSAVSGAVALNAGTLAAAAAAAPLEARWTRTITSASFPSRKRSTCGS